MSEKRSPLDIAKDIARESGNEFHSKVAKFFRDREWQVLISPHYVDPSTDKAREIDLIAEKLYLTKNCFGQVSGYVRIRLHTECKYINQTTVFWFDEQDVLKARASVSARTVLRHDNIYINQHHYLKDQQSVAKLFATEKAKEAEAEPMFRAINQTLNGLINNEGGHLSEKKHLTCRSTVDYPVIVCSSFERFFRKRMDGNGDVSQVTDNFLMEVNYAYRVAAADRPRSDYFLIDVIEFDQLDVFLKALDVEFAGMFQVLME